MFATPLFRHGRKLARNDHGPLTKDGRFRFTEQFDAASKRTVRVAQLVPMAAGAKAPDLLAPLWDATVIYADRGYWTITGVERIEVDGVDVAFRQSWALRELPGEVCEEIESRIAMGMPASAPMTMKWISAEPPLPPEPVDPRRSGGPSASSWSR